MLVISKFVNVTISLASRVVGRESAHNVFMFMTFWLKAIGTDPLFPPSHWTFQ